MFSNTIHQIWLGQRPFPEPAVKWRAAYPDHMPGWECKLWRDRDIPALAENALCPDLMLDVSMGAGLRSDVIRYEILRQHGGIYLDHDMEILRPLDEIIMTDCVHFGLQFEEFRSVGNAVLASPRQDIRSGSFYSEESVRWSGHPDLRMFGRCWISPARRRWPWLLMLG